MDEARRFIRYVFPGITAAVLFLFYCALADPSRTSDWLKRADLDIDKLLGLVLAAGALGYLLSVLHHQLYGSAYSLLGLMPDFRPTLANAVRDKSLALYDDSSGHELTENDARRLSPRAAWLVLNCIWFDFLRREPNLQPAEDRSRSLFDIMHASGTLFVGSVLALISWFWFEVYSASVCTALGSHWLLCMVALLLAAVLFWHYMWSTHLAEAFVASMTATLVNSLAVKPLRWRVTRLPKWGRRPYPRGGA